MSKRTCLVACWVAVVEPLMLVALSSARADDVAANAANEERIRQALNQSTAFDFTEAPFSDAIAFFAKKHDIPIAFDMKALTDVGITTDRPITKTLKGLPLRAALQNVLRDLDLTTVIRSGVILVTTPDEANKFLVRRIYDVHDLRPEEGYEKLVDTLRRHVKRTSWDTVGGAGSISYYSANGIDALIVTQTQEVQDDLEGLLAELRRLRKPTKE